MKKRITSLHVREKKSSGQFLLVTFKGEQIALPQDYNADLITLGRGWVFYSLDRRVWYHRRYGNAGIKGMYRANVSWQGDIYHFKTDYTASDFLSHMIGDVYIPDSAIFDG